MDYILSKLDQKIALLEAKRDKNINPYYRAKIEYLLFFLLGYVWNRGIGTIDDEDRSYIISEIGKPSIGTIIDICRRLDNEDAITKKLKKVLNDYPHVRNDLVGHGYVFADAQPRADEIFRGIANDIISARSILSQTFDLVQVEAVDAGGNYVGVTYHADGKYGPWCGPASAKLNTGNLYALTESNTYARISPFVHMVDEGEFYVFRALREFLTGRVDYSRLLKTSTDFSFSWPELRSSELGTDGSREIGPYGTIANRIKQNYRKYIDVPQIKRELWSFLKNKSSVCATLWGHGGVGKTAAVHHVCQELMLSESTPFDYLVFVTAKDRIYNYTTGEIDNVADETRVTAFEDLVAEVNSLVFRDETSDPAKILAVRDRVLIVIDDYETFPPAERLKIEAFVSTLDINYHKVIITTRAANVTIGQRIESNELRSDETARFFQEVVQNEFSNAPRLDDVMTTEATGSLHELTQGRPLFIFQAAYIWAQKGYRFDKLFGMDPIQSGAAAVDFLYGRIYDYFSLSARDLFDCLGLLVTADDPTNLTDKLRYTCGLDESPEKFNEALQELARLKVIELRENSFFRVYSPEILKLASEHFQLRGAAFKESAQTRLVRIGRDKKLDNETALLANADAARYQRTEEEVEELYRQILSRPKSPEKVRLSAAINLASYFAIERKNVERAAQVLDDYRHMFSGSSKYSKVFAQFCWASKKKDKAIQVLFDVLRTLDGHEDRSERIEVLGLLVTYFGSQAIEEKDDLKKRKRLGDEPQFNEYDKVKDRLFRVRKLGDELFNAVRKASFDQLSPGARQNASTGLLQHAEVCVRRNEFPVAIQICRYFTEDIRAHLPDSHVAPFETKLQRIQRYSQNP